MRRWLLLAVPILLAVLGVSLLWTGLIGNPILAVRVDFGTVAVMTGVLLTLIMGVWLWLIRYRQQIERDTYHRAALDHRRFLARLDHELKNPLTAIRTSLTNINDPVDEALRTQAAQSINTQSMRLTRLVFDLRKLADLETQPIEAAPVDLTMLLSDVADTAQDRPDAAGLSIMLSLPQPPWPLPAVTGDHDLLFIAVYNVLDNAIKYCAPGSSIEIRGYEDGQVVVIEVADAGAGIAEDDLPHVWDELYRGESALGTAGSGLGLALVRAIVRRHGGSVGLRSRLGRGTVVTLRLPIQGPASRDTGRKR